MKNVDKQKQGVNPFANFNKNKAKNKQLPKVSNKK